MPIKTDFPHRVRNVEHAWVPLPNGNRMAARLWLPEAAERTPMPAILTYLPYRKRDSTRGGDDPMHSYFAGHGYVCLRIDMQGSGDSEGLMQDEYAPQELRDGKEAIAWIARQPWCTGRVGMIGNSWGGFNALQVAAQRPPALRAIVTSCSTDDRYADDMHYMGGCVLNDNMDWGTSFFARMPRPPDPEFVGERWRRMWQERLDQAVLPLETWFRHQRRDAYWKHGSVCERFEDIQCPVFAVGGWMDGYSNAIPRLLRGLRVPRIGVIGPWAHRYGHLAVPGPAIGFLQEALRWWDHWLKDADTGIMAEPMLRVFMQDGVPAQGFYATCPGRWVAETRWPSSRIASRTWRLGRGGVLAPTARAETRIEHSSPQTVGIAGGEWCPYGTGGLGPQFPTDQREDDGRSVVFETPPLRGRVEILGAPVVKLRLAVDRPDALVAVRLNDAYPDGSVARVTFGVLNLTHRQGHERLVPMPPGKKTTVSLRLNDIAYAFAPGHRIRVAVSTSYWPMVWPSPEPVRLSLFTGASTLTLPVRPPRAADAAVRFAEAESGPPMRTTQKEPPEFSRVIERNVATGETTITAVENTARYVIDDTGVELRTMVWEQTRIRDDDPLSAVTEMSSAFDHRKPGWDIRVVGRTRVSATRDTWKVEGDLETFEGGARVFHRHWDLPIPRDHV
jgi:putative CocE/NonD family hydrolase